MSDLRHDLLSEDGVSAELPEIVRFLSAREGALIGLLGDHVELYEELITRYHDEGTSPELQAIALDAAGNLATVLQSLRSRQLDVNVLSEVPGRGGIPLIAVDHLVHCLVLLTRPCTDEEEQALLSAGDMHSLLYDNPRVRDWLLHAGVVPPAEPAAGT